MIPFVDLKRQYDSIKPEIDQAIAETINASRFIGGPVVEEFENRFAQNSGAKFGVGTSSGTSALHLALLGLGICPGDEVITVPNTFVATTEAIAQVGARIRFVDINEKTYNIDVEQIEVAITPATKAIIPVHLYGQPCDIDAITAIAQKHNLKVIYDAAQAHYARYKDQPIGRFGDAVCYSFYPGKNLGAYGDGGMVLTNNEDLAKKMRMIGDHGRTDKYEHLIKGYNYRLDGLQAAVLKVKLNYLQQWSDARRNCAALYNELLTPAGYLTPQTDKDIEHVYHLYVVRVPERDEIRRELSEEKIATGIHYPIPLHLQPVYQSLGYTKGDFPVTEKVSAEILSLPMFAELTEDEIHAVASALTSKCANPEYRTYASESI